MFTKKVLFWTIAALGSLVLLNLIWLVPPTQAGNCIDGTEEADVLSVFQDDNTCVRGKGGNDFIVIGDDADNNDVKGGDGDDRILNWDFSDNNDIKGGDGNDFIQVIAAENTEINGGDGDDFIELDNAGNAEINGGDGDDFFNLEGPLTINNTIKCGSGNDTVIVENNSNIIAADCENIIGP